MILRNIYSFVGSVEKWTLIFLVLRQYDCVTHICLYQGVYLQYVRVRTHQREVAAKRANKSAEIEGTSLNMLIVKKKCSKNP